MQVCAPVACLLQSAVQGSGWGFRQVTADLLVKASHFCSKRQSLQLPGESLKIEATVTTSFSVDELNR